MARIGIFFGLVLCGLTVAALSVTTEKSYTQFVPMMFGIPLLFLGVVGLNPHRRLGATVVALALGMIGFGCGAIRFVVLMVERAAGEVINPLSFRLVVAMTVVCLVFALMAMIWVRKRRDRMSRSVNLDHPEPETKVLDDIETTAVPDASVSAASDAEPVSTSAASANPYQSPRAIDRSTETR
jgi:HAMP domain-containing protein